MKQQGKGVDTEGTENEERSQRKFLERKNDLISPCRIALCPLLFLLCGLCVYALEFDDLTIVLPGATPGRCMRILKWNPKQFPDLRAGERRTGKAC
jgi:hypothetical protein